MSAIASLLLLSAGDAKVDEVTDLALAAMVHDIALSEIPTVYQEFHLNGPEMNQRSAQDINNTHIKAHIGAGLKALARIGLPIN